jgi:hypothetical protein
MDFKHASSVVTPGHVLLLFFTIRALGFNFCRAYERGKDCQQVSTEAFIATLACVQFGTIDEDIVTPTIVSFDANDGIPCRWA